jgi:hypothetical protein
MRFSIRDLLLVTVIVALVLGWYLDHRWQKTELERTTEAQRKAESKLDTLLLLVKDFGLSVSLADDDPPAPTAPKK